MKQKHKPKIKQQKLCNGLLLCLGSKPNSYLGLQDIIWSDSQLFHLLLVTSFSRFQLQGLSFSYSNMPSSFLVLWSFHLLYRFRLMVSQHFFHDWFHNSGLFFFFLRRTSVIISFRQFASPPSTCLVTLNYTTVFKKKLVITY